MSVRTTPDLVKGILLSDYGPKEDGTYPELDPFIDTASSIVDRIIVNGTLNGNVLGTSDSELIERWLAAHCYVQSDQVYASNKTLMAAAVYQGQTGMRLDNSKYGQMAVALDWTGELTKLGKKKRVSIDWMGKYPSSQIDYVDKE